MKAFPDTITKTCLYNFDPLKPHFYIVKLGFTGVYIIFLISAQKHRLWVLVRTAMFWAEIWKIEFFIWKLHQCYIYINIFLLYFLCIYIYIYIYMYTHTKNIAGLGGSVGCAVRLETRRSRVQPPTRSATLFRGDWSWNIFYGHSLPSADSRMAVVSFWRKNVHNTG